MYISYIKNSKIPNSFERQFDKLKQTQLYILDKLIWDSSISHLESAKNFCSINQHKKTAVQVNLIFQDYFWKYAFNTFSI